MTQTNFSRTTRLFVACFFCFATLRCHEPEPARTVFPAFYHWQTQLRLSDGERNYLDSLHVKKLYVKFFDVDWDESTQQPVPLAPLEMDTVRLAGLEIVPTVFITNRTLLNLPMQQVDSLTGLILRKIESLAPGPFLEIQFDCDWTAQTQAKYFALLDNLRRFLSTDSSFIISATIRLHQLKYFEKTGVPPVDRGMLMCYNMGDLSDWEAENSILDLDVTRTYLPSDIQRPNFKIDYPLPLDVALPLFRWGVLFRDDRMIKLLNNLTETDLQETERFRRIAPNRYEVLKSTYLQAHYLYAGDLIRLEAVTPQALDDAARLINKVCARPSATVAFYHLDSIAVQLFPKEKIAETLLHF